MCCVRSIPFKNKGRVGRQKKKKSGDGGDVQKFIYNSLFTFKCMACINQRAIKLEIVFWEGAGGPQGFQIEKNIGCPIFCHLPISDIFLCGYPIF